MASDVELGSVLLRQLKRLGIRDPSLVPSPEAWASFLSAVNDHYRHLNDDRALLTRAMDLSTHEMDVLRRRVEAQRDQLRTIVDVIGDALGLFGGIVKQDAAGADSDVTTGLEFAKNEFTARLHEIFGEEPVSDSESTQISGIHANVVNLADHLIRLLSETAEKASLKKELEVARAVQSLLVPTEDIIDRTFVQIAGYFQPASECGGDWWAVYDLPGDRVLVIVGDVTGHGISSAIITGAAKAASDLAFHLNKGLVTPGALLAMMNAAIHEVARRQIMMTCAAAVIDRRGGTLTFANAGHPFPYLVRNGHVEPVLGHGQPLGAARDSVYEPTLTRIEPNDLLVWYTDGIVECENDWGEQFTEKRFRAVCQREAGNGAKAVRDAVVETVSSFRRHRAQIDDMTLVVASVK